MKNNNTNEQSTFPFRLDSRPMDRGELQMWGFGYSRPVKKQELWRPALRYVIRDKHNPKRYRVVRFKAGDYYCSDHGRLFSAAAQGIINRSRKHKRNETHLIDENGNNIHVRLYKLMLDNWIEPPEHLRSIVYSLCDSVNHKDGDCWRDRLDNLQYSPTWMNSEHMHALYRSGKKKRKYKEKQKPNKQQNPPA